MYPYLRKGYMQSVKSLCNKLKVEPKTVLTWIKTGELKASKVRTATTTKWVITDEDANAYIRQINQQNNDQTIEEFTTNGSGEKFRQHVLQNQTS